MNEFIIQPLPTDFNECMQMLHDAILACTAEINSSAYRILDSHMNAFKFAGDDDDYQPAAAQLLHAIIDALHYHEYESPAELIAALFANNDLCHAMMTCDFSTPLLALIDYDDEL